MFVNRSYCKGWNCFENVSSSTLPHSGRKDKKWLQMWSRHDFTRQPTTPRCYSPWEVTEERTPLLLRKELRYLNFLIQISPEDVLSVIFLLYRRNLRFYWSHWVNRTSTETTTRTAGWSRRYTSPQRSYPFLEKHMVSSGSGYIGCSLTPRDDDHTCVLV